MNVILEKLCTYLRYLIYLFYPNDWYDLWFTQYVIFVS